MSERPLPWSWPKPGRPPWTPPRRSRCGTKSYPLCCTPKMRCGPARRHLGRSTRQHPGRHAVRRQGSDRPRLRCGRACGGERFPCRPRYRRADGAARRARLLRCRQRPLYASMPAPAARCGKRASLSTVLGIPPQNLRVAVARRRRQFRHPQSGLCRVRSGAVGGEKTRPTGQISRHALRSVSERLSGPRSRHQGRIGARR